MSSPPTRPKPVTVPDFLSARSPGRQAHRPHRVRLHVRPPPRRGRRRCHPRRRFARHGRAGPSDRPARHARRDHLPHASASSAGRTRAMVIADLPFMTFQLGPTQALESAGRLVKEGGAHAVKLEGGERTAEAIAAIVRADIPVMGHVGLTPQSVHRFGGFKVQRQEEQLLARREGGRAGRRVRDRGRVRAARARRRRSRRRCRSRRSASAPGRAATARCWCLQDMLGLYGDLRPKFVKRYADLGAAVRKAIEAYCQEVQTGGFPTDEYSFR